MMSFIWGQQGEGAKMGDRQVVLFVLAVESRLPPPADDLGDALQRGQPHPVLQSCTWMLIDPTPRFPLAKKPNVALFGL